MKCFTCSKHLGTTRREMKTICGSCREVLKADLVAALLELDPIYLTEANRNKGGRRRALTADQQHDAKYRHIRDGESLATIAADYGVSKTTIFNICQRG